MENNNNIVFFKTNNAKNNNLQQRVNNRLENKSLSKEVAIKKIFDYLNELYGKRDSELATLNISTFEWNIFFNTIYDSVVDKKSENNYYDILLMIINFTIPSLSYINEEITMKDILESLNMPLLLCRFSPEEIAKIKSKIFVGIQNSDGVVDITKYRDIKDPKKLRF